MPDGVRHRQGLTLRCSSNCLRPSFVAACVVIRNSALPVMRGLLWHKFQEFIENHESRSLLCPSLKCSQAAQADIFARQQWTRFVISIIPEFVPKQAPHHWQRGYFYSTQAATKTDAKQFELHRSVNLPMSKTPSAFSLCGPIGRR